MLNTARSLLLQTHTLHNLQINTILFPNFSFCLPSILSKHSSLENLLSLSDDFVKLEVDSTCSACKGSVSRMILQSLRVSQKLKACLVRNTVCAILICNYVNEQFLGTHVKCAFLCCVTIVGSESLRHDLNEYRGQQ